MDLILNPPPEEDSSNFYIPLSVIIIKITYYSSFTFFILKWTFKDYLFCLNPANYINIYLLIFVFFFSGSSESEEESKTEEEEVVEEVWDVKVISQNHFGVGGTT